MPCLGLHTKARRGRRVPERHSRRAGLKGRPITKLQGRGPVAPPVIDGRPSSRRSSSPSITSFSSSRRVTDSRLSRRSPRMRRASLVRVGQDPLDFAVDQLRRALGVQAALLRQPDLQEARALSPA